ncbi:FxLYD domain-containing protein [Paraburkholderia sp. OV446]|uniref:FxLYD domain-containing protein n=2 Tax=Bacteria TaxID=2 RepID=UPI000D76402F
MQKQIVKCAIQAVIVAAVFVSASVFADTTFDGDLAQQMDISYQPGPNNNVIGLVVNRSNREVDVTVEFKGYTADGIVSQGNPQATIAHLGAGETARFQCAGFFGMVKKVSLIRVRTSAPS